MKLTLADLKSSLENGLAWYGRRVERMMSPSDGGNSQRVLASPLAAGFGFEVAAIASVLAVVAVLVLVAGIFVGLAMTLPLVVLVVIVVGAIRTKEVEKMPRVTIEAFRSALPPALVRDDVRKIEMARAAVGAAFGVDPERLAPTADAQSLRWLLERPTYEEIRAGYVRRVRDSAIETNFVKSRNDTCSADTVGALVAFLCETLTPPAHEG